MITVFLGSHGIDGDAEGYSSTGVVARLSTGDNLVVVESTMYEEWSTQEGDRASRLQLYQPSSSSI